MEEKRSCHSMHSVRSTRSYLTRPTSDISNVDDEERGRKGSGQATNGHYIRTTSHGMSQNFAKSNVVEASSNNYLKVDGGAYRVQRSVSSGSTTFAQPGATRPRASSDAATQSVESSFTQTDESWLAPAPVYGGNMPQVAPPSPVPPVMIDVGDGGGGSVFGYTRATSPIQPNQYSHLIPSPYFHPPFYEPAYYHSYLNPMVAPGLPDGYQYEVVVRRPSMGPTELTVPGHTPGDPNRRPSMGHYTLPQMVPMHPPHSLPGSFDSNMPPPFTPAYNHAPQPLSPRHFPGNIQLQHSISTIQSPSLNVNNPTELKPGDSKPIQIPTSDIPKLIHETSI